MGLLVLAVVALVAIGALAGGASSLPPLATGHRYTLTFAIAQKGLLGFDAKSWVADPSTAVHLGTEPGTGFDLWTIAAVWTGMPTVVQGPADPNVVPAGLLLRGIA